ncbi:tRNA pseudouridine synthase B [Chondrocystis sp. NIES-4102]|nr:tRNA pseudouridine synthase B [Chondrocystis sp. NIES-4102]
MFGFINLHKPVGFTSHDCVAKLRRLLNTKKIGHGGTLDPLATGVLPIAVGKATRLLPFLPTQKAYRALIRLGVSTTTDDLEGDIVSSTNDLDLSTTEITNGLNNFLGTITQIPPMYSAIKKDGKKLYQLARKGETIELEPRIVTIDKIELINISKKEFLDLEVEIDCSPGTYIRAIARDLGKQLGVGGTLGGLVRTNSCGMQLQNSLTFDEIENQLQQATFSLIEPSLILKHLNFVTLANEDAKRWCQGQLVDLTQAKINYPVLTAQEDIYLATYNATGIFLGISLLIERDNILKIKPKIVC